MPQWATFVGITGVVLASLLVLSYLTQSAFSDADRSEPERRNDSRAGRPSDDRSRTVHESESAETPSPDPATSSVRAPGSSPESSAAEPSPSDPTTSVDESGYRRPDEPSTERGEDGQRRIAVDLEDDRPAPRTAEGDEFDPASLSTGALLANVAISQGLFALVLLGAVLYTGIPMDALGVEFSRSYLVTGLIVGTVAGVVLYVANELVAAFATRFGFDHDEQLRELLAPDSTGGWLVLLGLVLPTIAIFEELLFRAALVGVIAAGYGVSPWLLAVLSSVAFAVGHGMQGSVGVVVTGVLGFVLAAMFILTESLLVVVVAHYFINALEFVVHEGFDLEWAASLER
ncbi:CPBP family intramembrane glutamic endopeptidase [Natrarchaeobius oligotrophus]|uniref:CPBP family intramembrane metalloprotease n=1 Tax=Natrarchaeobius chitinivorans TaxID=1679083 RepID=A0A3N6PNE0_NATCH|nr:type II CAAX endopeptidase family protein [Natrarchaeobius chitinivorans]RQH03230.1 CPBP family intramembrane metalloprotease [Natrarchaeobius chitinivorans]